jgi:signal transduction histidine kinase/iron only hydrogenase large subunit-like protein
MTAAYIKTIPDRCRLCYTCVRECPAKAIRIEGGQARIVADRCIACGNCVRVCAKKAKQIASSVEKAQQLLAARVPVAVCLAPSFPADFPDRDHRMLVGQLRQLGFASVHEVSFGADLTAARYKRLLAETNGHRFISTACPAIVGYVERYHPELTKNLAPIVSPMIALARYLRTQSATPIRIVFVGPCIAKKMEADDPQVQGEIDAVLTFRELREWLESEAERMPAVEPSEFDPPHGGSGALYPVSRGALQAAGIQEDLMTGEIIATQGRTHVREAIQELADGNLNAKLLEVLCCEGCIMGAGMTSDSPMFVRRQRVSEFVCRHMESIDQNTWESKLRQASELSLARSFHPQDQCYAAPQADELAKILQRLGKPGPEDELNCGACGYETCREHAIAIHRGLAENEMCLPNTIDRLSQAYRELEQSHLELASAQEALMHSEKLASMGQLAAGIAHEVNNPLGIVLMYAHLLRDECTQQDQKYEDIQMIVEQADRCKHIVGGLLHFARQNKVVKYPTDIVQLVQGVVAPMRVPAEIQLVVENDMQDRLVEIDKDQIAQVLTNLVNNALAATDPPGAVTVRCEDDDQYVMIKVSDTGTGIDDATVKKIFEPFFTTKEPGKGTGLGLSVSYGIVKMHCGDIQVTTNADPTQGPTGSTFTVRLPRN